MICDTRAMYLAISKGCFIDWLILTMILLSVIHLHINKLFQ